MIQLRKYREQNQLTVKELSELINFADKTIYAWEIGTTTPDLNVLCLLADLFDISLDELVGR